MATPNMNYLYNVEYYQQFLINGQNNISSNNEILFSHKYSENIVSKFEEIDGIKKIDLYTIYPGMLIGIGSAHDATKLGGDDAIICGFTFDHVTGLPYLPGSSLKGILRSYFDEKNAEKIAMIKCILGKDIDIKKLREAFFETKDVFLGGFPVGEGKSILAAEYVTPHKEVTKNPIPIKLLKIKPNVRISFAFLLGDSVIESEVVSAEEKINLYKQLLLLGGVGAKTNVGFGQLTETALVESTIERPKAKNVKNNNQPKNISTSNIQIVNKRSASEKKNGHFCETCGKVTIEIPNRPGQYFKYCKKCSEELKKSRK